MIQRGEDLRLAFEARDAVGISEKRLRQDFDRDGPVQSRIACAIDFTHPAGAKRCDDLIGTDACSRSQGHLFGNRALKARRIIPGALMPDGWQNPRSRQARRVAESSYISIASKGARRDCARFLAIDSWHRLRKADDAMIRGAEPMTVAELKRHIDRRFLTKRGFRRELKRELSRFVTKDDLKSELRRFATKDDLKRFATRDDLKHYSAKDDLHELRDEMRRGFAEMRRGFSALRRDFMQIADEHEHRIKDVEQMHGL